VLLVAEQAKYSVTDAVALVTSSSSNSGTSWGRCGEYENCPRRASDLHVSRLFARYLTLMSAGPNCSRVAEEMLALEAGPIWVAQ
jgi:hypothetical protein